MSKKKVILIIVLIVLFLVASVGYFLLAQKKISLPHPLYSALQPPSKTPEPPPAHIVIIVEENKPLSSIASNMSAPYINSLMRDFAVAQNYHAVANPSLPNYVALTSGTTAGIQNDCNPPSTSCQANVVNIADAIERSGRTWKLYAEGMPQPCTPTNSNNYVVKHNPFMYYPSLTSNTQRCSQHVVPLTQLEKDLANTASLPNYVFITPDQCNNMHDCPVQTGDTWLSQKVPTILNSPAFTQQRSLLVITWDEGDNNDNHIPLVFAGPMAKRNYSSNNYYTHYSLLRTIEALWQLPSLAEQDGAAPLMYDMLN